MTVTVRLYAALPAKVRDRRPDGLPASFGVGVPWALELAGGASLSSLLSALRLEITEVLTLFVNGRSEVLEHVLSDGDQIGFFPPLGGG